MSESTPPDSNAGDRPASRGARHRRRNGRRLPGAGDLLDSGRNLLKGRRPVVALAATAVLGIGLAGVAAAATGGTDTPAATPVATDAGDRERAAERADRSAREAPAPTTAPAQAGSPPAEAPKPQATPAEEQPEPSSSAPAPERTTATPERAAAPAPTTPAAPKADWVNPMPGAATTSCYGQRWGALHAGIDLAEPANTPIRAAGAGTVTIVGWAYAGYGISVVIDHGDNVFTHYAHQNRTAVEVGQRVSAGQVIGYEGSTGDSTGPHLHFEVHLGMWNQVDPGPWMRQRGVDLGC
ncbi:peptidoglycan DD-metalloendopeptidase family protein [Polymorphospora sp. NPDC050346]|uniref:M23 family metallopeptidase n=1 Tax=Polymorphospora sp. NPDC050346 TaxID=3155780 RepID=UPI0033D61717